MFSLDVMADDLPQQISLTINLVPRAREIVDKLRADTGIPQTEAMLRILTWFASLDKKLRLAILNNDPETREELVRLAFASMLTRDADLPTLADLMRRIHESLAQAQAKPPKKIRQLPPPPPREAEPAQRTSKK
jgi:hypothetical protein